MRKVGGAVLFYILWTVARVQAADVTFTDITEQAGFGGIGNCSWAFAWGDHDGDGDLDIMTVGHLQHDTESFDRFFINNGNMTFTDGTLAAGIVPDTGDPHGAGWADFDNDGDADLLIMHGTTKERPGVNDNELYRNNGDGTFTDINDAAGTTHANYRNRSANWIDLNNDGLLDIFSTSKVSPDEGDVDGVKGEGNLVLRNNGDGTFTNISAQSGLLLGDRGDEEHFMSAWADYDGDHDLDVFIGSRGFLMSNNGDGTFTDVTAAAGIVLPSGDAGVQSKGAAWGDYDNDGDMDLFMTALVGGVPHTLYRNNGDRTFTNVSATAGVDAAFSAGATVFADVDNDGDLDLYVVSARFTASPNRLYRNNGDGTFTDIAVAAGAAGPPAPFDPQSFSFQGTDGGFVDVNDDGFLDTFSVYGESGAHQPCEGPYMFLQNDTNGNHWLKVQPVGVQSNRDGIGAEITIRTGDGKRQVQHYVGGQHYISQDRAPAHFGVGANTQIQSLEVRWPSGVVDVLNDIPADRTVTLVEGSAPQLLSVTTTTLPDGQADVAYQATLGAVGGTPPYSFGLGDGSVLPAGLALSPAGVISGIPTTEGIFSFTVTATDAVGASVAQALTLTVARLHVTTLSLPEGTAEVDYSAPLTASGGTPPYTWTIGSGTLPNGLSLDAATGVISGIPTEGDVATLTVTVTDSLGTSDSATLTLTIVFPINLVTAALPSGIVGVPYDVPFEIRGGSPPYIWTISAGNLPPGLALSPDGGNIFGTPTTDGRSIFTVKVTDLMGAFAEVEIILTILEIGEASVTFTDLSQTAGFSSATSCSLSAAWSDADNDGDIDVMVVSHIQPLAGGTNHFYRNNGDLTFTDVIDQNGLLSDTDDPHGAGWGDFDNDGDADLAVGHGLLLDKSPQNNELYENAGNGIFSDIAARAGILGQETQQVTGVSWIDENNDGFLDLFFSGKTRDDGARGNFLYRSNRDGTFSDAAERAGLSEYDGQTDAAAWQDYDDDGDLDVFLCFNRDQDVELKLGNSVLYRNNGDGTYLDATAASGLVTHNTCKSAAWGDYNNDGFPDLFISSLGTNANALYQNRGDGTFDDVGAMAKVDEKVESHGATWGDYDNDGHLDLLVITGNNVTQHNRLYRNQGDGTFVEVSTAVGAAGLGLGKGADGMMVDVDNDGALDIFVTNGTGPESTCGIGPYLFLHNNNEDRNHWLNIQPVGQISNRDGIGAKVWLTMSDGRMQYRQHFGQHFFSQDRLPLHFGLGAQTEVERIEVHWPSGEIDILTHVAADQTIQIIEGESILRVKTTALPDARLGVFYNVSLSGGGGSPPYTWTITGDLPSGLSLSADGVLSGTPDILESASFTVTLTDAALMSVSRTLSLAVTDPVVVTTATLPHGTPGMAYDAQLTAEGGVPPYLWAIDSGSLPDGLVLDSASGTLSGTPSILGSTTFTVLATDKLGASGTATLTLTIEGIVVDVTFTDLAESAGLTGGSCSWSAAWTDYDNDGRVDVVVTSHLQTETGGVNRLYHNDGNMTFTDVTAQSGVEAFTEDPHGAAWGDMDNDGDADLMIAHGIIDNGTLTSNERLYRNEGGGLFSNVTEIAGVAPSNPQSITAAAWVDDDRDGLLDIFLSGKTGVNQELGNFHFRNQGDGTFLDVAASEGLGQYDEETVSTAWQDYDQDGDVDVFMCLEGVLFGRNADGTYTDRTATAGITTNGNCRGSAWGDYDRDGDPDLYISALQEDQLYRNNGNGTFTDVTASAGITDAVETHAVAWGDIDNDGDLDLLVVTGANDVDPNRLYRNNGDGTFTDIAVGAGVGGQVVSKGSDGMMVDVDDDGFLDLFITNGTGDVNKCLVTQHLLFHNNAEGGRHWLKLQLVGRISNRDGIGAKVWVTMEGGERQYWEHTGSQHFISQDRLPLHFGLGPYRQIRQIEVHWPSGVVDIVSDVAADQTLRITEGFSDTDDDSDGVLDTDEIAAGSDPLNAASTPEVCDGLDNDLDGGTDEGFLDSDGDGVADCVDFDTDNDGVSDTDETAAGSDPLNVASTPEICDGLDNDLDGTLDEGFPNLDGDGMADCVDTDDDNDGASDLDEAAVGSDPLNAASTPEVCDGLDNDLDGTLDEGFPNLDGDGMADCVDTDDDNDGASDLDEAAVGSDPLNAASTPEVCDGLDNDLNEGTDEGFLDTDGDGVSDCVDTDDDGDGASDTDELAKGSDPLNAASTPEVCDGLDNDLDGTVDESSPNLDGDGMADCVDPDDDNDGASDADEVAAGSDPSDAASTPEVCDGVNNDLNDGKDEGFPNFDEDNVADCVDTDDDGDGVKDAEEEAAGSDPLNAASTPEVCDGRDNDLNDGVDEGIPTTDTDGDGTTDCIDLDDDSDGVSDAEEAAVGSDPLNQASTPEVCDGLNNDLDAKLDEGFPNSDSDKDADCIDLDDDGDGVSDAEEAAAGSNPLNPASRPEVCDGLDNDLNEGTDEGFPDTDGDGVVDCVDLDDDNDGASDVDEVAAGSDPLDADSRPEVCDGVDNDLDNVADDGFPDTDGDGVVDCLDTDDDGDGLPDAEEMAVGSDPLDAASTPEVCDGLDNDLDKKTDEGFPDLDGDQVADCSDPDDDGDGASDVDEAAAGSDPIGAASTPEVCDGLDNDLNEGTDEGFSDTDGDGVSDCVDLNDDNDAVPDAEETVADSDPRNPASTPESCDGLDNDRDGRVDDGFPDSDGDGIANCLDVEVCDGMNNDLDGLVDEGFPDTDGDGSADCVDSSKLGVCGGVPVTLRGTSRSDILMGTAGPDVIDGLGGHDRINGLGGDDILCGGEGNDTIRGGTGSDKLYGGPGNDRIRAGRGDDFMEGGDGEDKCYGGRDRDAALSCEKTASVP